MSTGKGGSSSQITGYRYFMALQHGLCRGPINTLYEIRVGDLTAWSGTLSVSDFFEIDKPNLFGGDQKEGGIDGTAKLFMGESTQTIDTIVSDNIEGGFPVPGWRGVSSVFYYGLISSNNPYPKPWKFKVGRTSAGWDTTVWQPTLVMIPMTSSPLTLITFNTQPHSGDTIFIGALEVAFFTIVAGPPDTNVQIGSDVEATAAAFATMVNSNSEDVYDGTATVNGSTVTLQFPTAVTVAYGHGSFTTISNQGGEISAMNPAHILYECLTNTVWGRGLPTDFIDEDTFLAAATALYAEGFGLCMKWNREGNIDSFVKQVVDHIAAALFIDRQTGKIKLNLIRDNYDHDLLEAFTFENGLLDVIEDETSSNDTSFNEIIVKYIDPVSGNPGTLRVQNLASFQAIGSVISVTAEYLGLPTAALAARVGQRDLQMNASDIRKFKLKFDRVAWYINPGDVLKLHVPTRGIDNLIVRAGEIEDGELEDETITIVAVQDIFSLPDTSFITPQPSYWTPPDRTARVIDERLIDEMTYFDLAESIPPGELGVITEDTGLTKIFAEPPSGYSTDYVVASKTSLETDYVERNIAGFDAGAEMSSGILLHGTTLNFESVTNPFLITATGIPVLLVSADDPTVQEYCELEAIDLELGTATINRGCIDTIPHVFATGDKVWFQTNMPTSDFRDYSTGEIVDTKLLTRTTNDKLSLSLAVEDEIEIGGRQGRPYPPGKLMIAGIAFELSQAVEGEILFEWAHRDRITQGNFLVDHDQTSTGPESNVKYNVYVYDGEDDPEVDSPIRTVTDIDDDNWTYTTAMDAADGNLESYWFKIESERDPPGLKSWQKYVVWITRGSVAEAAGTSTVTGVSSAVTIGAASGSSVVEAVSSAVGIGSATGSSTAQADVVDTYDAFNSADKSSAIVLTNDDRTAEASFGSGYRGVRSIGNRSSGKYHFEAYVDTSNANSGFGIGDASASLTNYVGVNNNSIGYYQSGSIYRNGSIQANAGSFTTGAYIECEVDLDGGTIQFRPNNSASWTSVSISALGAGPFYIFWSSDTLFSKITINVGNATFDGSVTSGYTAWG